MATRLLSFLGSIESALRVHAPSSGWDVSRMVNYHLGLARMIVTAPLELQEKSRAGGILLQDFKLADGSTCVKASLSWDGCPSVPLLAVYAKPQTDWDQEAAEIAAAWLRGPENQDMSDHHEISAPGLSAAGMPSLVAAVG